MRILHTSDWHLGHHLHDHAREFEHARFLEWLTLTLESESIDALLIAGDIFDTANPSARAQSAWYGFLADIHHRMPELDVAVIGGNHDSGARLNAPVPLLRHMRIHIVGSLPRTHTNRRIDTERTLIPLHDKHGHRAAWVAAVPYLRPVDLPSWRREPLHTSRDKPDDHPNESTVAIASEIPAEPDPLIWGVRQVYRDIINAMRQRADDTCALLAMGHCYMVGTEISRLSERAILGGNQHALPVDIFPDDLAYVALGHLHKAQRVGGREGVRYCGSPIALSLGEANNRKQVLIVEFDGPRRVGVRALAIPRTIDIVRVPKTGALPLDDVPAALAALEDWDGHSDRDTRPYLEVRVLLSRPEVQLRHIVDTALVGKRPRLVKLAAEYTGDGNALADAIPNENLADLQPSDVFIRRYRRDHEEQPSPELLRAFGDLLDDIEQSRGDSA